MSILRIPNTQESISRRRNQSTSPHARAQGGDIVDHGKMLGHGQKNNYM
jgi:hypothetical protein